MNGNSLGVVLSSGGSAAAERSEGEPPGEPKRSAAAAEAGASPCSSRPNSEVVAKAKRRTFPMEYKIRILEEADAAAATPGGIGALLRWEGLYSSHLVSWRRERQAGILEALKPRKRGPRSERNSLAEETQKLRRQVGQLTEKLRKAELIIDVQKKVAALLGTRFPTWTRKRNPDVRGQRTSHRRGHQRGLSGSVDATGVLLLAVP
jgi:transposase